MTIGTAIVERLESMTALTALVSTRIYRGRLPQPVQYPAVLVEQPSVKPHYHLRGDSGLDGVTMRVSVVAQEASGRDALGLAEAVAEAVRGDGQDVDASGLSGWRGDVGSPPEITIQACFLENVVEYWEPPEYRVYRILHEYGIWYRNPVVVGPLT